MIHGTMDQDEFTKDEFNRDEERNYKLVNERP